MISFEIPIKVISEMNWRGHWAERYSRLNKQKRIVYQNCIAKIGPKRPDYPIYKITLTRLKGYRQRDYDTDNLASSFKAVRDGIAEYLGIDDGSKRFIWVYRQQKGDSPGIIVGIEEIK